MAYMNFDYWLSICIPTFNRADSLKKTIDSIIAQESFDNSIEIIISDNASTDNTYNVAKSYEKYKNIKYYRNEINLNDYNFISALSHANGEYIKLLSDNKPVCKNFIINLKKAISKKPSVIFHKNMDKKQITFIETNTISNFINFASFYSTWLPGYTFRKEILDMINYKNLDHTTKLVQTEIALKVLNINPKCIFIIGKSMDDLGVRNKGGYNIFKVFIVNYLNILKTNKNINRIVLEYEKSRLLIYFVFSWFFELILSKNRKIYTFDKRGWILIIVKNYWYNPLLYTLPFYVFLRLIKLCVLQKTYYKH